MDVAAAAASLREPRKLSRVICLLGICGVLVVQGTFDSLYGLIGKHPTGLEPVTFCLEGKYSIQLS